MKFSYDQRYNIAYLTINGWFQLLETIHFEDVNLDVSKDGMLVGIEFLNANEQLL